MKEEEVETPLESICLQFKVSQPFYFHILATTEETCFTNCYFKMDKKGYTLHQARYQGLNTVRNGYLFGTIQYPFICELPIGSNISAMKTVFIFAS